jgi:hypothetical protein
MRVLAGIVGVLGLLGTLSSVLRTLIVPRGAPSHLVDGIWLALRTTLRAAARVLRTYEARDRALAWLAPLMLVSTLAAWIASLLVSYGLLMYAVSGLGLVSAFREAGSSLFTLGFASGDRTHLQLLDFCAAASGPVVVALLVSYLPTLYSAYNRRETEVTLLQSRAGEPAWGPELLARQGLAATTATLPQLYEGWERLAADIGESHANYPVLLAFRSPNPYRSWIVALITVTDAAALHLALCPATAPPQARLLLRMSFTALRDIARVVHIPHDADPRPEAEVAVSYAEFAEAVDVMRTAGFPMERTAEQAWPHFRGWRVNYESIAYELARRIDAVPALWTGPRDSGHEPIPPRRPPHRGPQRPEAPGRTAPEAPGRTAPEADETEVQPDTRPER